MRQKIYFRLFIVAAFFVFTRAGAQVNPINIGTSPNFFVSAFGARTQVWADPWLNTVIFVHRDTNGVVYDISKNRGANWSVNQTGINAIPAKGARYPMG